MEMFFKVLVYFLAGLFFDVVIRVVHYVLYGETVGHCLKNDPPSKKWQKVLIVIFATAIGLTVLFAVVLGFLLAFNI